MQRRNRPVLLPLLAALFAQRSDVGRDAAAIQGLVRDIEGAAVAE